MSSSRDVRQGSHRKALAAAALVLTLASATCRNPAHSGPGAVRRVSLDGRWEFTAAGGEDWRPAVVPGCVHLDLMRHNLIPDPFYRDAESAVQWVEEEDWRYRRIFDLDEAFLAEERVDLVFDGLDTFARITVNGRELGSTDNMFRAWKFPVKPFLRPGRNEILIRFDSPVKRERLLERRLPYKLPGEAPHIRKAPYQFGWDWGPRLATSGVWRPAALEAWSAARIEDLQLIQDVLTPARAALRVKAEILSTGNLAAAAEIALEGINGHRLRKSVRLEPGPNSLECVMEVENPSLWWPAGMGEQPLYTLRLILRRGPEVLDSASLRTGLRTLTLEQIPDAWGTCFRFSANGVPFFAKGGNWIPADSFPPRVTRERYERLLEDCVRAHMNMIRVWGGGIYESPDFYDLCDELGLVVWQDFMFACALYPGDEDFLLNESAEAGDIIRRLRHHPCLALWCGNNECEEGWFHWGWKEALPASVWSDYERIFHDLLPRAVRLHDPGRAYWPSSPHSLRPGEPRAEDSGDMHVWDVWHGGRPFESYRDKGHRFLSEFGFQSFPLLETVRTFARPEDWSLSSPVMRHHQKHPRGNDIILHYLDGRYRMPEDFESLLWLSQVLQAEGMKTAVEHFRSLKPRTMGALYWQLNDCWPTASWSGIDYTGRWKALHYYARRFFSPVLAAVIPREGKLDVHVVSDRLRPLRGELRWTLASYDGRRVYGGRADVDVAAGGATVVLSRPMESFLSGTRPEEVYLHCSLEEDGRLLSSNIHHFTPLKTVDLPDPGLTWRLTTSGGEPAVTVSALRLAKNVHLEAPGFDLRFEDNFFDLLPGEERTVAFDVSSPADISLLKKILRARSLRDSY
ncbi:MAG: glycoside hydrolase family 2 protein [Candidatus Aminicenantes bacterium]|nr:glycoside hydrolase family 2 protein [Candidatus Aminicenantes bacterium]